MSVPVHDSDGEGPRSFDAAASDAVVTDAIRLQEFADLGQLIGDPSVVVRGVRHDSRTVASGEAFVALSGAHHDGAEHAMEAIERGASVIVSEKPVAGAREALLVANARRALPRLAHRVYGDPTGRLDVVGVTGTNGKTTVTHLVEEMLLHLRCKPALMGTVTYRGPGMESPAPYTTPEADVIARFAKRSLEAGATHLVMEVSSHALAQWRADAVHYRVAAFTNLSHDHLDYHGSWEAYQHAKGRLFRELAPSVSVIVIDEPFGEALAAELQAAGQRVLTVATRRKNADLFPVRAEFSREGIRASVQTPDGLIDLKSPLLGKHNLENLLVTLGIGLGLGFTAAELPAALAQAKGAPGRLERVPFHQTPPEEVAAAPAPLILVDYAHTPDALRNVLETLRALTPGRLWVLFGCGGDRDREKRPLMGRYAAEEADVVVISNDNPRSEDPVEIAAAIRSGCREAGVQEVASFEDVAVGDRAVLVELDRRRAIEMAVAAVDPGDTLVIAGKGHETTQTIQGKKLPFDDRSEARQAIRQRCG